MLIGFSLVVASGFLLAFIWSVKSGQYEDDYTPSVRILFEDELPVAENEENSATSAPLATPDSEPKEKEPKT